ncbi:uncharacterized protein PRCAT00001816001 [Priceomyces carsonii]|uniref:uncharacterized protein n=1 Tax=Priceomyces carsonii TaxID=28549 RepID=UPI002EDAF0BA|nr:unnamed protein product [Priceomyces carsonii]
MSPTGGATIPLPATHESKQPPSLVTSIGIGMHSKSSSVGSELGNSLGSEKLKLGEVVPQLVRPSKRSPSHSNDILFERDRFRARFHNMNPKDKGECQSFVNETCEVCDSIGFKTTKLNIDAKQQQSTTCPLEPSSSFFRELGKENLANAKIEAEIKSITSRQINEVFKWYFNNPLPETSVIFPWLHGLNKRNHAQRRFFIFQQHQQEQQQHKPYSALLKFDSKPKNARFLMCIRTSESAKLLKNTIDISEVLSPIDISNSELRDMVEEIVISIFEDADDELIDLLVKDCNKVRCLPMFLNLDPDHGISLRNFHIQVAKIATLSDFIIYGEGDSSVSRLIWIAQRNEARLDNQKCAYNVFVLKDVDDIEDTYFTARSEYVSKDARRTQLSLGSFDSKNMSIWDTDYQIKEKIETSKMSTATELDCNVWVGNIWNYQVTMLSPSETDFHYDGLKKGDLYCDSNNSIVVQEEDVSNDIMSYLPPPSANWRLFVYCHNEADFPQLSDLLTLLRKVDGGNSMNSLLEYTTLEFPPTGSIGLGDCKKENLMSIVNTCKLIYAYSKKATTKEHPLSALIYCSDGYTELSLLVLCYIMYCSNIALDEAILKLHLEYGRPFYMFNTDVVILKKLELILRKCSPLALAANINWSELEQLSNNEINDLLLSPVSVLRPRSVSNSLTTGYLNCDSDSSDASDIDESLGPEIKDAWVHEVEGTLPSRMLKYLYLGSLKHANSLSLLTKLEIKEIISVGERLDWINGYKFKANYIVQVETIDNGNIEILTIIPKNDLASQRCSVRTVVKINNLQDDGIDELSMALPSILRYIDEFYKKSNGNTKILVHCRVGVSRSATVVIAEVMRRLKISLARAYLYVRVRRLSIIIQPNLRFMYELFKWEENQKLLGAFDGPLLREVDWFIMCREIMRLNNPYLST